MSGGEPDLQADAQALATILCRNAGLWQPAPFHDDPSWVDDLPDLASALLALDDGALAAVEHDARALTALIATGLPDAGAAFGIVDRFERLPVAAPVPAAETLGRDVPGRKWRQVLHFAGAIAPVTGDGTTRVVEWCCGKAHLGRLLARQGTAVTGIEWNRALCTEGARLALRDALDVRFVQADVLRDPAAGNALGGDTHAVALHACGDLHVALLREGVARGVPALSLAPCCYHLTADAHWQPLSRALAGRLRLRRDDLRLAVQETVTSGARVRRQTATLAAWRLGFDRLQRALRGVDAYLPCPSQPARALAEGFPVFCARLAAHHGIALPVGIDFAHYAALGEARHRRVARLELLRHAFRRPLELLLVLDRALYLSEQGYQVQVSTFCPRPLTPRNLLIRARRSAGRAARVADTSPG